MFGDTHRPDESKRPRQATRRTRTVRALILTGAVTFVAYWAYGRFSPPEIGEPFDVAAFQAYTLSDGQNAFTFYRKAVALLVSEEAVFASNATLKRQDRSDSWKAAEQGRLCGRNRHGGSDLHGGKGDWAIHVRIPGMTGASPK